MISMNRVTLIGNLGSDPDYKVGRSGVAVLNLSVATSESYREKGSDGWKSTSTWHKVVMFGSKKYGNDRLERLALRLCKGMRVFVEGSIKTEAYEKNGEKRYVTKVFATMVDAIASDRTSSGQPAAKGGSSAGPASQELDEFPDPDYSMPDDGDIPF